MATRLLRTTKTSSIGKTIYSFHNQYKLFGKHGRILSTSSSSSAQLFSLLLPSSQYHTTAQLQKLVDFNLSDIGEGIREVVIKEWFVKEGDVVEQFDNLCEVQSDKASVTITSRYDGKIAKLYRNIDEIALVGQALVAFDVIDDEPEADKLTASLKSPTPAAEKLQAPHIETSSTISHESTAQHTNDEQRPNINNQTTAVNIESQNQRRITIATPAVRRIAIENNVDLKQVTPTGKLGRVLKSDVLEYLNIVPSTIEENNPIPVVIKSQPITEQRKPLITPKNVPIGEDRVEKLKGIRKMMLKSMTETLKIPHFAYSDEIDVTKLVQLRQVLKTETETLGIKLTFMPFFIKAASFALAQYPILNSTFNAENETIVYKAAHNISVAMATPDGLVVPNIKNCQLKTIVEIASELQQLQAKGLKGQLTPDDFANGTFSLSNIGVVGGTYTHPCILAPQVSIGAIGTTKLVPRFGENDEIVKAHVVCVSWSADHRVIDGVTMASFSNAWKKYVENPAYFILQ